jgi:hypothetical protein
VNYTELTNAICDYTQNFDTDFIDNIPVFVQQAEERIFNTVQFPALRKNQYSLITVNNKYVSLPNDFLSVFSLALVTGVVGANLDTGTYEYLLNKDVNFIRQAYPSPNDTGEPKYYALFGPTILNSAITTELSLILGPTPDAAYYVELHYFYYPTSIVTAGTSWLGDNYDPVLLYGSLVEAITFMKGEADMVALYNGKYTEALAQAKRLGDGLERGDAYRDGQYKQKVI